MLRYSVEHNALSGQLNRAYDVIIRGVSDVAYCRVDASFIPGRVEAVQLMMTERDCVTDPRSSSSDFLVQSCVLSFFCICYITSTFI